MRRIFLALIFTGTAWTVKANDRKAFEGLLFRIVGAQAKNFRYEYTGGQDPRDVFELSCQSGKVVLRGNNNNALAVALHHYLKYYCYTYVSWYADDPIELPAVLPLVPSPVKGEAQASYRFFLNYCTFGYSFPWWQWKDWERLIDWMALNGINRPLAIAGQEAVWLKVWKGFGLSDTEIRSYFTGPAHLPWHRMSNIDGWQGPLPLSYIEQQLQLQKKIVDRERALGMKPILPAFSGHVPKMLRDKYPAAKISALGQWSEFPQPYRSFFLDPFDSLFKQIQKRFIEEQTKAFGSDHLYGSDPFNEVTPPSWDTAYLASVARTIYSSLQAADPQASWMMMSWIFYFEREHWTNERIQSFVRAVPQDKIILLDYYGEHTEVWKLTDRYYGQPYIWCYLGNFGGNSMLAGNFSEVGRRLDNVFVQGGENLSGVGSTLEGLDVNGMMYDFVLEKGWRLAGVDTGDWVKKWAFRRLGTQNKAGARYWKLIADSVYTAPARLGQGVLTNARPSLSGHGNWTTDPSISYSNELLLHIWEGLAKTPATHKTADYDLVNLGRQFLGNHFSLLRDRFSSSYEKGDSLAMTKYGKQMLELFDDLENLLSSHPNFLVGKWIEGAKAFGKDAEERKYYEHNARVLLTTWSGAHHMLNDYANRGWGGLTGDYYKPRWKMFVEAVVASRKAGKHFDENAFLQAVTAFEWAWTKQNKIYPTQPKGDPRTISQQLIHKYSTLLVKSKAF